MDGVWTIAVNWQLDPPLNDTLKQSGRSAIMPITDAQLAQYEEQGAVTIDTPFTPAELNRAEAAWDRLKQTGGKPYEDPDYIEVVQHPYFEEVAKKVLRAEAVHLWWGLAPHERPPASPRYAESSRSIGVDGRGLSSDGAAGLTLIETATRRGRRRAGQIATGSACPPAGSHRCCRTT